MWQKLSRNPWVLSTLAALSLIFAYAPFDLNLLALLLPFFLGLMFFEMRSAKEAACFGFFHSVVLMWGGFYWVVYVIHVFGYLPWSISVLLYCAFLFIAAVNVPLFAWLAYHGYRRVVAANRPVLSALWFTLAMPALCALLEYLVPKLFPWYFGHAFYKVPAIIQVVELTGCSMLTFAMFSSGNTAAAILGQKRHGLALPRWTPAIPVAIWGFILGFGFYRLGAPAPNGPTLNVALIQANIGSLERLEASSGIAGKVRHVMDRYLTLTERALKAETKPDLLLWPETAMPFQLEGAHRYAQEIRDKVAGWGVPLVVGAYAQSPYHFDRDYNAAFLVEPLPDQPGQVHLSMAPKNVLLAFGEYMPLGDTFPALYRWFPQVSNFELGRTQSVFQMKSGARLGVTICYEAIKPAFVGKVANQGIQVLLNLTNDSWFGPTSEPYQHGQLAVFRAVETRTPLVRITNTGTSFIVDEKGYMGPRTPIWEEAILPATLHLPAEPPRTLYVLWGEWLNAVLLVGLIAFVLFLRKCTPSY